MSALDKILDHERWNDDSYGDLVTQVSSPTGANTLDAAREELRALRAELVEMREAYDEVAAKRLTLHAENAAMREALERAASALEGADDELHYTFCVPEFLVCRMAIRKARDAARTALGGRDA